jgi:hypothetical protein
MVGIADGLEVLLKTPRYETPLSSLYRTARKLGGWLNDCMIYVHAVGE